MFYIKIYDILADGLNNPYTKTSFSFPASIKIFILFALEEITTQGGKSQMKYLII